MFRQKLIASLLGAALFAPLPAISHDKCDSLAIATTAGGVFWAPLAGFQVGYYLAKFVDESTSSSSNAGKKIDLQCAAKNFGTMSEAQYASIASPAGEDPNQDYKFLWDASGELAKKSLALNQAVATWQGAREALRDAQLNGDQAGAAEAIDQMDDAHARATKAFESYQLEHFNYAAVAERASGLFASNPPPVFEPLLTVDDVVKSANVILDEGAPPFEERYFREIGCVLPEVITPAGILEPADRFVNDDVKPGTHISNGMLVSASALYREVATTFGGEVAEGLEKILPDGFAGNEPLPLEMEVMTEGRVLANDLGIKEGTLQHTSFMVDLDLQSVAPLRFIDPWRWHWIVGTPWDWLFGFELELIPDAFFPGQPQPQPSDLLRVVATFDDDRDRVMGLGKGSRFVQDLHLVDGSLARAVEEDRLPNAMEMNAFLGGSMSIMDESGKRRLLASIDKLDPNPKHVPVTLIGTVGDNKLGVEPGTLQRASFMLDLGLTPIDRNIFIDPWWWHWVVGNTPWDWLRGFEILVETNVPRPGDPDPWDRLRIVTTFDEPQLDMVMELPEGSQFIQELYFPVGSLNQEMLPSEDTLRKFAGGDFQIADPKGEMLLTGKFDALALEAVDSDEDGMDDFSDNCAAAANKDQRDTDGDGFGNECDGDLNNDGIVNTRDLGMFKSAFGSRDEHPDADFDGDGIVNTRDLGRFRAMFGKEPGPSAVGMLPHN